MANLLSRFERALEDAFEGTSRRLFRARVQPVQLAKAATRAMEEHQVVGFEGPEVPNDYLILLHPVDFAHFAPYRQSLQAKIEAYLAQFAADRGLRPVAPWRVTLDEDPSVKQRSVAVDARMSDVDDDGRGAPEPASANTVEPTMVIPRRSAGAPNRAPCLHTEDGRRFALQADVTSLGRALDNEIVISDSRVSRYHAEIRRDGDGHLLRDLGSTNGTAVAGKRITEHRIAPGDDVSLGGYLVYVRTGDA